MFYHKVLLFILIFNADVIVFCVQFRGRYPVVRVLRLFFPTAFALHSLAPELWNLFAIHHV